jgi:hypothetical protein
VDHNGLIINAPKMLCKATITLMAMWTVATPWRKEPYSFPSLKLKENVQEFVHCIFVNLLQLKIRGV